MEPERDKQNRRLCGANKRKGRGCCRAPAMANGRCRIHGGKSPTGIASPQFKDGRYSKVMPTALAATFQEALRDPELISHREHVAMYDARIMELLDVIGKGGGSRGAWARLQAAYASLEATDPSDRKAYDAAVMAIGEAIDAGATEGAVWAEIQSVGKLRRQAADSEMKRLHRMHSMVSAERVVVLLQAVVALIRENVEDSGALFRIQTGMQQLMNHMSGAR